MTDTTSWRSVQVHTYPPQMSPIVPLNLAACAVPRHLDSRPDRLVSFPVKFVSSPSRRVQPYAQSLLDIEIRLSSVQCIGGLALCHKLFAMIRVAVVSAIGGGYNLSKISAILWIYIALETRNVIPLTGLFSPLLVFCAENIFW